jgi:hypothetical protein
MLRRFSITGGIQWQGAEKNGELYRQTPENAGPKEAIFSVHTRASGYWTGCFDSRKLFRRSGPVKVFADVYGDDLLMRRGM